MTPQSFLVSNFPFVLQLIQIADIYLDPSERIIAAYSSGICSETLLLRPPMGLKKSGLDRDVVLISRLYIARFHCMQLNMIML